MNRVLVSALLLINITIIANAQDGFDAEKFVKKLNTAIKANTEGVTVNRVAPAPDVTNQDWIAAVTGKPQDFAVVAMDANDKPIDIFGASAPYKKDNGSISIVGYELPAGGKFKTVGAAGWAEAAAKIAAEKQPVPPPSSSIGKAVSTIIAATDYIAQELCPKPSRPTKLVLNLSAGFELVFTAATGTEVEWDLEVVCKRLE